MTQKRSKIADNDPKALKFELFSKKSISGHFEPFATNFSSFLVVLSLKIDRNNEKSAKNDFKFINFAQK